MKPVVNVTVDGKPVSGAFFSRLMSLSITDKEGTRADVVSIKLDDSAPFLEIPRRGAKISVAMGYEGSGTKSMGDFIVDEVEISCLPYSLSITGKSADMRETLKELKNRHWDNASVKDIVAEIAGDHGLSPAVSDVVGGHVYEWFGQMDENDMDVLERLATRHNALFTIKEGRVIFAEKGAGRSSSGRTVGDFTIGPEIIVQGTCKASISDRGSFGKVVGYYQDKAKSERTEVIVNNGASDSPAIYRIREAFSSVEEAEKGALTKANSMSRGGLTTSVAVIGDASIRAGGIFTYAGVRPGLDGIPFIIETAEHTFSKTEGYRTKIDGKVQAGKNEGSAKGAGKSNGTERAAQEKANSGSGSGGQFTPQRPGDGPE